MAKGFRTGPNYSKTVTIQDQTGWLAYIWRKYGIKARNEILEIIAHADEGNWVIREKGSHYAN